jgi:hypothetical protein
MALVAGSGAYADSQRWSPQQAQAWSARQPWLVGANYIPANAINQLEMWQADTFDPATIDRELTLAQGLGMNTMRVFLHDQLYAQDPKGFAQRIDAFLTIAHRHGIRPMLVLFDSCWDPDPKLGPQHPPIPGVHNSGWVQSPSAAALKDSLQQPRLEAYVKGIVGDFARDDRILAWDLWNEPANQTDTRYKDLSRNEKHDLIAAILPKVFEWARGQDPIQPLTSGVFRSSEIWGDSEKLDTITRTQLMQSDIISFHSYGWPEKLDAQIKTLQTYGRPLILTEYMARGAGSTFDTSLPLGRKYRVGMINWGFVLGKTQTDLPWDSWQRPYVLSEPQVWFHDIFKPDLTPYRQAEVDLIRRLTAEARAEAKPKP